MIIYELDGTKSKEIKIPEQFQEPYHPNLIKRAVSVIRSNKRQKYGAADRAGKRSSARVSRRRRDFRGSYGKGISRAPRKVMWRRGTQFSWEGAIAPGTKGGRKAHPPKSEKDFTEKINIKEKRKAMRSALTASLNLDLVKKRNHIFTTYPLFVVDKIENITKTKDLKSTLEKLGLKEELQRVSIKKIRAGKGSVRGRKYKKKIGPLIIVSKKCELTNTGKNLQGVDIKTIDKINTELLAPGTQAGRLTIFTEKAIERMEKEKLFM